MIGELFLLQNSIYKSQLFFLGIVIFTVFSISLSEQVQIINGFSASGLKLVFETNPGETVSGTWAVINDEPESIDLEFFAEGPGSELLVFEEFMTLEPKTRKAVDIFVIVPENHENNVEYRPSLYALKRGYIDENAGAAIAVNLQMKTVPIIKIGPDAVFVPEIAETVNVVPSQSTIIKEKNSESVKEEETLEEKLARIQAANKENVKNEPVVISPQFDEKITPSVNEGYDPEPLPDPEPIVTEVGEIDKNNCNFFEMFLSWFGIGKC